MTKTILAALAACAAWATPAASAGRPVVVELFTSQGCSSCPPAEAVLLDFSRRHPDVLALGFHVDYWDRLGWKDPYSSPAATRRQRAYQGKIGSSQIYTPQMVVDGKADVLGSDEDAALSAVRAASARRGEGVPLALARTGDSLTVTVGSGRGTARALLVGYDPVRETAVRRGENAGRTIQQANVVRSIQDLGEWRGEALTLSHAVTPGERHALILQSPDGTILGAAR